MKAPIFALILLLLFCGSCSRPAQSDFVPYVVASTVLSTAITYCRTQYGTLDGIQGRKCFDDAKSQLSERRFAEMAKEINIKCNDPNTFGTCITPEVGHMTNEFIAKFQATQQLNTGTNFQGEWQCTDIFSKRESRLVLSPDGSVSASVDADRLIRDPWLHWYFPIQKTGNEQIVILRISIRNQDNIVVQNPNDSVENCVR